MPKKRLNPLVGWARQQVSQVIEDAFGPGTITPTGQKRRETQGQPPLILVGLSGGPDSLALASLLAHFKQRGDLAVGAIIVDHQLQAGSAQVAAQAAQTARRLGLDPVLVETVEVTAQGGPEHAARTARYAAYCKAAQQTGAQAIALGHTLNDQAETVLLGLVRGSGTRSLAGMPADRTQDGVRYLRPLLNIRRQQILEICADAGLTPWQDPSNQDQTLTRARIRHRILPFLQEELGGDPALSLARTAAITGPDADYLSAQAQTALNTVSIRAQELEGLTLPQGTDPAQAVYLDRAAVADLHPALRTRVLALAYQQAGGAGAGYERLAALEAFSRQQAIAGPLQLPGHVQAYRLRPAIRLTRENRQINLKKTGLLVLLRPAL